MVFSQPTCLKQVLEIMQVRSCLIILSDDSSVAEMFCKSKQRSSKIKRPVKCASTTTHFQVVWHLWRARNCQVNRNIVKQIFWFVHLMKNLSKKWTTYISTSRHEVISLCQAQRANFVLLYIDIYIFLDHLQYLTYRNNISHIWHQKKHIVLV